MSAPPDAYVRVILTDENDIYDAMGQLRPIYPNLMRLDYDNLRTRSGAAELEEADVKRDPLELFAEFYQQQNRRPMTTCCAAAPPSRVSRWPCQRGRR